MDQQTRTTHAPRPNEPWFAYLNGFSGSTMRMATWPIELWLRWQADMLNALAPATTEWIARRRQGTESALRALEQLGNCTDASEYAKIQSDWAQEQAKRLEADFRFLTDAAQICQQASATAGRHAWQPGRAS